MSKMIDVPWTALACLIWVQASPIAYAQQSNSNCGSVGNVCAKGFTCLSVANGSFRCVMSQSKDAGPVSQKPLKRTPEDLLKGLSGANDDGMAVEVRLAGDSMVGPCVGVAPSRKPHVDRGVPSTGRQPRMKILRPIIRKLSDRGLMRPIVRGFQQKRGELDRCHSRARAQQKELSGKMNILVLVAKSGKVSRVRVMQNTTHHDALSQCVTRVINRMRFSENPERVVEFEQPLVFGP